jgi:hypothetical protein
VSAAACACALTTSERPAADRGGAHGTSRLCDGLLRSFFVPHEVIDDDAADEGDVDQQHDDKHARHAGVGLMLVPLTFFGDERHAVLMPLTIDQVEQQLLFFGLGFRFHGTLGWVGRDLYFKIQVRAFTASRNASPRWP